MLTCRWCSFGVCGVYWYPLRSVNYACRSCRMGRPPQVVRPWNTCRRRSGTRYAEVSWDIFPFSFHLFQLCAPQQRMGGQVGLSGLFYRMNAGSLCACVFLCAALLHYYGGSSARGVIARQCRVASSSCLVLAGRALGLMASRVQFVRCLLCFVSARCFLLLRVPCLLCAGCAVCFVWSTAVFLLPVCVFVYLQERLFLFRELICKDVDWTGLGMPAYSCFNAFFTTIWTEVASASARSKTFGDDDVTADLSVSSAAPLPHPPASSAGSSSAGVAVEGTDASAVSLPPSPPAAGVVPSAPPLEEEDLTELGVDTLWRVTLTSLDKEVADSATLDLLTVSDVFVLAEESVYPISRVPCSCVDILRQGKSPA